MEIAFIQTFYLINDLRNSVESTIIMLIMFNMSGLDVFKSNFLIR